MKRLILTYIILCTSIAFAQTNQTNSVSTDEISYFRSQMQQQVQIQETRVRDLLDIYKNKSILTTSNTALELQNAITVLEVKKTLMNKFYNSSLLQSARLRGTLLALLSQETIGESDIAYLQSVADEERAKLAAEQNAQKNKESQQSSSR